MQDKKADLVVNTYVDDVMRLLLKELNVPAIPYNPKLDPTKQLLENPEERFKDSTKKEWTIGQRAVSTTRKRLNKGQAEPDSKKLKPSNPRKKKDEKSCNGVKVEQIDIVKQDPDSTDLNWLVIEKCCRIY